MKKIYEEHLGDVVYCDLCGRDYTFSKETGGLFFESKAICPVCAPEIEIACERYGEQGYIKDRCPSDKSFADWVRDDLRPASPAGDAIIVYADDTEKEDEEKENDG